ncbi:hypothetical protein E4U53_002397 [Claviceps sorghi]|nr:hypothetical protein E4U53_002397 [Claviceps sorghi]
MAAFKPALLVVDCQEDFCPPNGAIPVPHGRDIITPLNTLLALPFALKIGTRDAHPPNHISFTTSHPPSHPPTTTLTHPSDPTTTHTTALWPPHCIAGSPGAALVADLHAARLDAVVDKGTDPHMEMYSAFYDPFRMHDSGLAAWLKRDAVTDIFVGGLAADYCVRATAEDALAEGFRVFVVEEATRPAVVEAWAGVRADMMRHGVGMVSLGGPEIARVRALADAS